MSNKSTKTSSWKPTREAPSGSRWRENQPDPDGGRMALELLEGSDPNALMDFLYEGDRFLEFALMPAVTEPILHHPEGDVGTHMRLVMRRAFELSDSLPVARRLRVRLAALCHDLGKVATGGQRPLPPPDGRWLPFDSESPRHPGHDFLGIEYSKQLFSRLAWPQEHWDFVAQFALYHQSVHQLCERDGRQQAGSRTLAHNLFATAKGDRFGLTALRLAVRPNEDTEDFALSAQSDAQGRAIPEGKMAYPQARLLLALSRATRASGDAFKAGEIRDEVFFNQVQSDVKEAFAAWTAALPAMVSAPAAPSRRGP
jgi:hypothetical protein